MKSSYTTEAPLRGIINIEIQEQDIAQDVDKKIDSTRKSIEIPGFRKGKVPKSLVEKRFGQGIRFDVASDKAQEEMRRLYKEENIRAITMPLSEAIKLGEDGVYEFRFTYPLSPDMKIEIDKSIELPFYVVDPEEEDVDKMDEGIRQSFAEPVEVEAMGEKDSLQGKLVQLDEEGNPLDNGLVNEYTLVIPFYFRDSDQTKKFEGAKKGDKICFNPALAYANNGAMLKRVLNTPTKEEALTYTGDFLFEVEKVEHLKPAEPDEKLFKKFFGEETSITDMEAYRKELRKRLCDEYENQANIFFRRQLIAALQKKVGRPELDRETLRRIFISNQQQNDEAKKLSDEELTNEIDKYVNFIYHSEMMNQLVEALGVTHTEEAIENRLRLNFIAELERYGYSVKGMEAFVDQMVQKHKNDEERLYEAREVLNEEAVANYAKDKITLHEEHLSPAKFNEKVEEYQKAQVEEIAQSRNPQEAPDKEGDTAHDVEE